MSSPADNDTEDTDANLVRPIHADKRSEQPYLVVVEGGGQEGRMFRVSGELVIGRSGQCDISLDVQGVSRRHASVKLNGSGEVELKDLQSRNGTLRNGDKVDECVLKAGDSIQLGPNVLLKLTYRDELEEAVQERLYEAATRDPLTGAHNRKYFFDTFHKDFAYSQRHDHSLCLLMIDVDHFKKVNDEHGHAVGDRALKAIADVISKKSREGDLFARYGGEEFALLLRRTSVEEGVNVSEELRRGVEALAFDVDGKQIPLTVSVGVACLSQAKVETVEQFLEIADRRLLDAKVLGRNRVCAADGLASREVQSSVLGRDRRKHVRVAVPLSVRIRLDTGDDREHTVRDVSRDGLFVYTDPDPNVALMPRVGQKATLTLALTAGIKPLVLEGTVVRTVELRQKGDRRGFALRFDALDDARNGQLKDLLARSLQGRGTESRSYPRLYPLMAVNCAIAGDEVKAILRDVGEGGLCLVTDRPLAANAEVTVHIPLDGGKAITTSGWAVSCTPMTGMSGMFRVGVRFARLSSDVRVQLRDLLARLTER